MGETRTPHLYGFGFFESVTKPQNQQFLSLVTPGHLNKIKNSPQTFKTHILKSRNFESPYF